MESMSVNDQYISDTPITLTKIHYTDGGRQELINHSKLYCSLDVDVDEIEEPIYEGGERTYSRQDAVNAISRFLNINKMGITKAKVQLPGSSELVSMTPTRLTQYLVDVFYGDGNVATPTLKFEDLKSNAEVTLFLEGIPAMLEDSFMSGGTYPLVYFKNNEFAPKDIPYLKESNGLKPEYADGVMLKLNYKLRRESCVNVERSVTLDQVQELTNNVRTKPVKETRPRRTAKRTATRTTRSTETPTARPRVSRRVRSTQPGISSSVAQEQQAPEEEERPAPRARTRRITRTRPTQVEEEPPIITSPQRSVSPPRRSVSPAQRSVSPRASPIVSPAQTSVSPPRRSVSPAQRSVSPPLRTVSSPQRSVSPARRSVSPRASPIVSPRSVSPGRSVAQTQVSPRSLSATTRVSPRVSPTRRSASVSPARSGSVVQVPQTVVSPRSVSPPITASVSPAPCPIVEGVGSEPTSRSPVDEFLGDVEEEPIAPVERVTTRRARMRNRSRQVRDL